MWIPARWTSLEAADPDKPQLLGELPDFVGCVSCLMIGATSGGAGWTRDGNGRCWRFWSGGARGGLAPDSGSGQGSAGEEACGADGPGRRTGRGGPMNGSSRITNRHLERSARVYVRQSTQNRS